MASECIRSHRGHRHRNRNRRNNSNININSNSNVGGTTRTATALAINKAMCFSLMVLTLINIIAPVQASISFVESGKVFPSKVDALIGQPLLRGYEYMGRLQAVSDNPILCPGMYPQQKFDIVTPTDGLPGKCYVSCTTVINQSQNTK